MAPKKGKGKEKVEENTPPMSPILDVLPDPIFSLDLGDTVNIFDNYDKCMNAIISIMDKDTDVKYTFIVDGKQVCVPVTPGINDTPDGTYVIKLTKDGIDLHLVATKNMSWFRGLVTNTGRRYEITDHRPPKIMKRSGSLGTDGMYTSLLRGEHIANVKLGIHRLHWAFYVLAKLGEGGIKDADEKLALAIIILMFFEGPRFPDVCERVKESFLQDGIELGKDNQEQINNWCDHSRDFYDEKGREARITISETTSEAVKRIAKKIRIMCRSMWDLWKSKIDKGKGSTSRSS